MRYEQFIAFRYLRSKKRTGYISFTTMFSFSVIILGVACLAVILSIFNGFESVVVDGFLALDSHVRVTGKEAETLTGAEVVADRLASIPEVTGFSPYVFEKAMLTSKRGTMVVNLKGVDPASVDRVSRLREKVVSGTDDFTRIDTVQTYPGIIIGAGVRERLSVLVGDRIKVSSTGSLGRYFGMPKSIYFTVTGIFMTDIPEYDYLYSFISLDEGRELFNTEGGIHGFDVNGRGLDSAQRLAAVLDDEFRDEALVKTWYDLHENLFASMKLEKLGAMIILSLIILVASFSIASSLIMLVLEKRQEIGILRSMGSSESGIRRIFMTNGMIIGGSGTLIGLALGFAVCWLQKTYEIFLLPQGVYIIDAIPVQMQPLDFVAVGLITVVLTYIATLYPARQAAGLQPSKALRYE